MEKVINIVVRNNVAQNVKQNEFEYICGNSDFIVVFDFDEEWDAFNVKTARFRYNGTYQDVVFEGNRCEMPRIENTHVIQVGVFAGNLHTTTPAEVLAKKSILCGSGLPAAPGDDVYAQLMDLVDKNGIFVATYESTTNAEIYKAASSGKMCFCATPGKREWFPLSWVSEEHAVFGNVITSGAMVMCECTKDEWKKENKLPTYTIDKNSTDNQYPTAKAVYDFVTSMLGK